MKKFSLLASDMLRKEEIASIKGGKTTTKKTCGCICIGPLTPVKVELDNNETASSDGDCTDCGASNAQRATNTIMISTI